MTNDSIDFQMVTENVASTLEPNLRVVEYISPTWNFIIVAIAMVLMVMNKQLYSLRFRSMLSVFTQSGGDKFSREWNPIVSVNGLMVFLSYIAMLALVVQKIVLVFSKNTMLYNGIGFYLDICAFIALLCILQYLVISLYGWLFGIENAAIHQEVTHLSMMVFLNVVMIVFGLVMIFYPTKIIIIITIVIILIVNAIRIIKSFFEFQSLSRMNLLNNFLYFCTLEIIPLSVAVTMLCRLIVTDCVL